MGEVFRNFLESYIHIKDFGLIVQAKYTAQKLLLLYWLESFQIYKMNISFTKIIMF